MCAAILSKMSRCHRPDLTPPPILLFSLIKIRLNYAMLKLSVSHCRTVCWAEDCTIYCPLGEIKTYIKRGAYKMSDWMSIKYLITELSNNQYIFKIICHLCFLLSCSMLFIYFPATGGICRMHGFVSG